MVAAASGASCAGLVAVLAGGAGAQGVTTTSPPDLGLPTAAVRPLSVGASGAPEIRVDASAPSPAVPPTTALPPVPVVVPPVGPAGLVP